MLSSMKLGVQFLQVFDRMVRPAHSPSHPASNLSASLSTDTTLFATGSLAPSPLTVLHHLALDRLTGPPHWTVSLDYLTGLSHWTTSLDRLTAPPHWTVSLAPPHLDRLTWTASLGPLDTPLWTPRCGQRLNASRISAPRLLAAGLPVAQLPFNRPPIAPGRHVARPPAARPCRFTAHRSTTRR